MTGGPIAVSNGSALCTTQGASTNNWCVWITATQDSGGHADLTLEVCRPTQSGEGTLHYATRLETDFRLVRAGHTLWRWSDRQSFPAARHSVAVGTGGQCYLWQTTFDGRDDSGRAIKGNVTVVSHSTAAELVHEDQSVDLDLE